ncbi:MAG TPA: hypothetical protein VGM90_04695 [Kofleriaceae bacterium]|jgi:hypothetical protein
MIEIGVKALAADIEARFGPPTDEVEIDGLGTFDHQLLTFPCGMTLDLLLARSGFHGAIDRSAGPIWFHGMASDDDLAHIAFHLSLPVASVVLSDGTQPTRAAVVCVMRRDDNGNEVEVTRVTSRCEADAIAAMYTARGHKQIYWVL